jgi:hypothetical protein
MFRVVFQYDDGTEDEVYVESETEALEYEDDEDFAYYERMS